MTDRRNGLTYAEAGVDIDAGNALVEAIKPLAKATRRPGADASLGGFGALFDLKAAGFVDPLLDGGRTSEHEQRCDNEDGPKTHGLIICVPEVDTFDHIMVCVVPCPTSTTKLTIPGWIDSGGHARGKLDPG